MSSTGLTNKSFINLWRFFEKYLPNYYSRDDVLLDDILFKYIDGDEVCEEDMKWIEVEFNSDKTLVKEELVRLETKFATEALRSYYDSLAV